MSALRAMLGMTCAITAQAAAMAPAMAATPVAQGAKAAQDKATPAPAGAERAPDTFMIAAFDISGVTALPQAEIERLVYPFEGPGRTNEDVEKARKALQDAYSAHGYGAVLVEVPVQGRDTFAQGVVQIAVSEVPVGQVTVSDSRYHSLWIARAAVPSLAEGKPIDIKALQADITLANHFPDRTINPVFKPGRAPGTLDVDLKVDDHLPLHASVQIDNDASPSTDPLRLTASVRYTNLFQTGQSANATFITSPQDPNQVLVVSGAYNIPVLNSPWSVAISGYYSNSNVASAGGSSVLGKGYQVGVRGQYTLSTDRTQQTISFGPDFKHFDQNIAVNGTGASTAPLRYIPFELSYAINGATEHSSYTLSFGTTFGFRVVRSVICVTYSAGVCTAYDTAFHNREANSNENFFRADLSLDYSYALSSDIIGAFRLTGQIADSHLVTNEQFSGGGQHSVRGYYSSEVVGDDGIAGSFELRSPSFASHFGHWLTEARLFGFVDSAYLRVLSPLPGAVASYSLVSVGGGLNLRIYKHITGQVLGAVPLHSAARTGPGDPQIEFSVKADF